MKYTKEHKNSQVNSLRTETGIVPASPLAITPQEVVERGKQAKAFWEAYNQLLRELREPGDFVKFRSKTTGEEKELPTKFWMQKLEFIFDLSVETEIVSTAGDIDDTQAYIVQARVGRGNRWVVATGACAPQEFIQRRERARAKAFALQTAMTRAVNRATARLLALRSISAEEIAPEVTISPEEVPEELEENNISFEPTPPPPKPSTTSSPTSTPRSTFHEEKWALIEKLIREWGEEKPTELAKQMFRVDRLADLGVPQLREVKKALEGRK